MTLRELMGSGDRIMLFTLPFVVVGVALNVVFPDAFEVGGPGDLLRSVSTVIVVVGVALWLWSVAEILMHVPRGELITTGPFALVRHPIYTSVALLVIPWAGFLLNTWVGVPIGIAMYVASRRFAAAEEVELDQRFGEDWRTYRRSVLLPWL